MKDETQLTRLGRPHDERGQINPSVARGSTMLAPSAETLYNFPEGRTHYGRVGLETHNALRDALSGLQGGAGTALTSSGLMANTLSILASVEAGGRVLAADCIYGPVRNFLTTVLPKFGVKTEFFAPDMGAQIADLITDDVQAILLESPGSLTMELQDIPAITKVAREKGVITIIDDTWSAGLTLKPLQLGVDYAAQALTKYIGGHSDLLMGAVVARDEALFQRLQSTERSFGFHTGPDDVYLALRGMRSLAVRMERSFQSAMTLAAWLKTRPEVGRILHPAHEDHPQNALFKRDFSGGCGLFSVEFPGWDIPRSERFLDALDIFGMGFSWGGFESLAIHCDPQLKRTQTAHKHEGALIRFSIGLEAPEDLIADLEKGFAAANG
ncbi:cystathionine beta-lyase [Maricaulis parjimensis]|uniref:cystathionine beta-lyase n=1 Tax=Maricaulis parjimensis TaxID=144023 RepID=UPI00193A060A|nr:cystathionine beta-lyase [Maricaulis parjimensis]